MIFQGGNRTHDLTGMRQGDCQMRHPASQKSVKSVAVNEGGKKITQTNDRAVGIHFSTMLKVLPPIVTRASCPMRFFIFFLSISSLFLSFYQQSISNIVGSGQIWESQK